MIEYFIVWSICIFFGALLGAAISEGSGFIIGLSAVAAAIISGGILVLIWAILTVSEFFGIPLLVIIAIVILAFFIFGKK